MDKLKSNINSIINSSNNSSGGNNNNKNNRNNKNKNNLDSDNLDSDNKRPSTTSSNIMSTTLNTFNHNKQLSKSKHKLS